MLDKSAIEKIEQLTKDSIQPTELNGVHYIAGTSELMYPPLADAVEVLSLQSLVDIYPTLEDQLIFHVESPTKVCIMSSKFNNYKQREYLASANITKHVNSSFEFDRGYSLEKFIIAVQTGFIRTENLQLLIDKVSKVSIGEEGTIEDDGITQTVTAKAGVALMTQVALPNPVRLKAFKTFPEIDTPEEDFIFRVSKDGRQASFKLIQSKSMQWELETCEKIKEWIKGKIAGAVVI